MQLDPIPKDGTTKTRKSLWDKIDAAISASQKIPGKNVSVDVHDGYGSIISINPQGAGTSPFENTGACCIDGECSITTESECSGSGGNYLGNGTTCDGVDCTQGACCDGSDCSITTEEGCTGTYQGDGTPCDPNPCALPDCSCGFDAFDGSGRRFLTRVTTWSFTASGSCDFGSCTDIGTFTFTSTYDEFCNFNIGTCSGTDTINCEGIESTCSYSGSPLCDLCPCPRDSGCDPCGYAGCSTGAPTVISATHAQYSCTDGGESLTIDVELFDECNPI